MNGLHAQDYIFNLRNWHCHYTRELLSSWEELHKNPRSSGLLSLDYRLQKVYMKITRLLAAKSYACLWPKWIHGFKFPHFTHDYNPLSTSLRSLINSQKQSSHQLINLMFYFVMRNSHILSPHQSLQRGLKLNFNKIPNCVDSNHKFGWHGPSFICWCPRQLAFFWQNPLSPCQHLQGLLGCVGCHVSPFVVLPLRPTCL